MNYRIIILLVLLILSSTSYAQIDLSAYSASKRTKMAEEEMLASDSDRVFQKLMTDGVSYFESDEYEEAIAKFKEAGKRRPINVYPPVMIEDAKLAMANHVEAAEEEEEIAEEVEDKPKEPELSAEERVEQMYQAELAKVYEKMPPPPKEEKPNKIEEPEERDAEGLLIIEEEVSVESIKDESGSKTQEVEEIQLEKDKKTSIEPVSVKKEEEKSATPKDILNQVDETRSLKEIQTELAAEFPDGMTEQVYTEGNRTITKRIVVKDGLGNEYRKVKHGWGGVFYFKNGISISEHQWLQETAR